MKKNFDKDANKEFHNRPSNDGNKTTSRNLPNIELYDNDVLNEQKIQRNEKLTELSKHMSLMFPWDLYEKIVQFSKENRMTITDMTIDALNQYLSKNANQNNDIEKSRENVTELEKERSGGEQEFDSLEKTIKNAVQKDSEE